MLTQPSIHSLTLAVASQDASWLHHFEPRSLFHLVTVLVCMSLMAAACVCGRILKHRSPEDERRFRIALGLSIVIYQLHATILRFLPEHYDPNESWPLHLCRLAVWIAAAAMIFHTRRFRALLYFWGICLCTQAFVTPLWTFGLASPYFWLFWLGHTQIVGAALYDITVHNYRPKWRDLGWAMLIGVIYFALVMTINRFAGTNYSYLGMGDYTGRTIVKRLGPYPGRTFAMAGMALGAMIFMWAVPAMCLGGWRIVTRWRVQRRIRREMLASAGFGSAALDPAIGLLGRPQLA